MPRYYERIIHRDGCMFQSAVYGDKNRKLQGKYLASATATFCTRPSSLLRNYYRELTSYDNTNILYSTHNVHTFFIHMMVEVKLCLVYIYSEHSLQNHSRDDSESVRQMPDVIVLMTLNIKVISSIYEPTVHHNTQNYNYYVSPNNKY